MPPLPPDGSCLASRSVFFRPPSIWLLYRNPTFHIVSSLDHPMHGNITMSSPFSLAWTSAAPDGRSQLFWPSISQGRKAFKLNSNVCHWHLASPMAHVLRPAPRFQKSQFRNTTALLTRTRTARRGHSTPPRLSRLPHHARKGALRPELRHNDNGIGNKPLLLCQLVRPDVPRAPDPLNLRSLIPPHDCGPVGPRASSSPQGPNWQLQLSLPQIAAPSSWVLRVAPAIGRCTTVVPPAPGRGSWGPVPAPRVRADCPKNPPSSLSPPEAGRPQSR